jgi:hypothetical protein
MNHRHGGSNPALDLPVMVTMLPPRRMSFPEV